MFVVDRDSGLGFDEPQNQDSKIAATYSSSECVDYDA